MIQDEMPLEDLSTPSQEIMELTPPQEGVAAQWPVVEVMETEAEPEAGSAEEIVEQNPLEPAADATQEVVAPEPLLFEMDETVPPVAPTLEPDIEVAEAQPAPVADPLPVEPTTLTAPADFVVRGGWTISFLLIGIGIIACCVLVPQGDQTRQLMYEREKLRADLGQIQKQVATNSDFLKKVSTDPTLAERLAQRQMKLLPAGTRVLNVDMQTTSNDSSPFLLVSIPPPAPMAPYQPRGGIVAQLCRNGRSQLYLMGAGLMLAAAGLVLGGTDKE